MDMKKLNTVIKITINFFLFTCIVHAGVDGFKLYEVLLYPILAAGVNISMDQVTKKDKFRPE